MPNKKFADRPEKHEVEEGRTLAPKFDENGLLPAIATDCATGDVLMLAYMNAEALAKTLETGEAHYWSRSRSELWHKGATSGNVQKVRELRIDCDQDAVWMQVEMAGHGAACHVGYKSCFFRSVPLHAPPSPKTRLEFAEPRKTFDPNEVYGEKQ